MKKWTILTLFLLFAAASVSAQQRVRVFGHVSDESGSPVIGATVIEQGTQNGATTGDAGFFEMHVSNSSSVVEISFLGFNTVRITATELATNPVVTLRTDAVAISDVVVIGYGTARKDDLTGSVVAIKADEFNRGAVATPQEMLMGKVPGLHIVGGNGSPGSGSQIRIRGAASLKASNDPLVVIDGVPISNEGLDGVSNVLGSLNPEDIDSFTILKDASATAIYGSRASNGVIIITTKEGTGGKVNVRYNSSYSVGINSKTVDMMSASQFRSFIDEQFPVGDATGDAARALMGTANTDWQKQIYRPAFSTDQNISVSGRVPHMPYRVSLGFLHEDGTLKTSNYQRGTVDASLSPKFFKDHLTVSLNAKGTFSKVKHANDGAVNGAVYFDPTQDTHARNADGSVDYTKTNGWWNWMSGNTANTQSMENPLSTLYDNYQNGNMNRFIGNAQIDYKFHFLPQLRANVNLGMDVMGATQKSGTNVGSFGALRDADYPGIGKYTDYDGLRRNKLLEAYLAYGDDFGKHHFDVMAGYSWQHFYSRIDRTVKANETGDIYNESPRNATEHYLISFFGRANYSYDSRYMLTVTLRDDASSRFSKNNRWGLFPSVAVAWNIKNEAFLKDSHAVSALKLRLGWGRTGQQEINQGDYPYLARYVKQSDPATSYYINGQYYNPLQPLAYNEDLKWETTETYNIGIDYGFLRGRLEGSLDFYFRKTFDLLNEVPAAMGTNFSNNVLANIGNMENKGVEFAVTGIPIQTKDWNWRIGLNATWQKTAITKLTAMGESVGIMHGTPSQGVGGNTIQIHEVGYAPSTFHTYQQVYDSGGRPIQNLVVDGDGDGVITEADRYVTGKSPDPDVYFGINSTLRYKNWDFSFSGHGSFDNWLYNDFFASTASVRGLQTTSIGQGYLRNYSPNVYKSGFTQAMGNEQILSDYFLENASFFRMDNIALGYTFNNVSKANLRIRTAFSVQNAFVITKYSGLDPEGWGIDNNMWPRPRIFSLRLSVNF